jgi:proline iminopeptidase
MQGTVSKINGVSLWHITQGQGIPLVLIQGGPGSYDYLGPVAEMLDNRGYRVIRYEQRGSWRSEKKGPYDVETFIEDLEHLRIHLGLGIFFYMSKELNKSPLKLLRRILDL